VAAIAAQVATALGAAHQEGIVHRALSPENILLLSNSIDADFVKVRDFGMAKLNEDLPDGAEAEDEAGPEVTATGLRVGDPRYMPPEYISTAKYEAKGDIYALGGVLYHILTGRPPYIGTRSQMLSQHVSARPPLPGQLAQGIPDWLDQLVIELLGKAPDRRPGVHKIVARVEDGLGHRLALPDLIPLDSEGRVPAPAASSPQRLPWPLIAVGVGVVLCAGTTGLVLVAAAVVAAVYALSLPS
jgi:serine/threonine-protein kinase